VIKKHSVRHFGLLERVITGGICQPVETEAETIYDGNIPRTNDIFILIS